MTARQKEILDIISVHFKKEGVPPTLREIGRDAGITSLNGVADHLKALIQKGWLRNSGKGRSRAYTLSAAAIEASRVDLHGVDHLNLCKLNDFAYTLNAAVIKAARADLHSVNHPSLQKLNDFASLRKLKDFVRDFPDNIMDDLKSCATPQEGALLIMNIVDNILCGDY